MKKLIPILLIFALAGCSKQSSFEGLARTQAFERYRIQDSTQAHIDTIHIHTVGDGWDSFLIKITPSDTKVLMAVKGGIIPINSGKSDVGICVSGIAKYKGLLSGYEYKTDFKINLCK